MVLRCFKDCMTKYGTFKVGLFEISNEAGFHLLKNRNFEQVEGVFALDLQSQVSKMTLVDCLNYPQNLNKFCPSQEYFPVYIKQRNEELMQEKEKMEKERQQLNIGNPSNAESNKNSHS